MPAPRQFNSPKSFDLSTALEWKEYGWGGDYVRMIKNTAGATVQIMFDAQDAEIFTLTGGEGMKFPARVEGQPGFFRLFLRWDAQPGASCTLLIANAGAEFLPSAAIAAVSLIDGQGAQTGIDGNPLKTAQNGPTADISDFENPGNLETAQGVLAPVVVPVAFDPSNRTDVKMPALSFDERSLALSVKEGAEFAYTTGSRPLRITGPRILAANNDNSRATGAPGYQVGFTQPVWSSMMSGYMAYMFNTPTFANPAGSCALLTSLLLRVSGTGSTYLVTVNLKDESGMVKYSWMFEDDGETRVDLLKMLRCEVLEMLDGWRIDVGLVGNCSGSISGAAWLILDF